MIRPIIAIFDLLHVATNIAFFVVAFNIKLSPVTAFVYLPVILISIWSLFFGFRHYLLALHRSRANKPKIIHRVNKKPLGTVLEL